MVISGDRMRAGWELSKLVHDLDMLGAARLRRRIAGRELTVAQASALYELDEPMTMGQLAEKMSCEPSNATVVVDRLEQQGLLTRHPHPTDRRAKHLLLTALGETEREHVVALLRQEDLLEIDEQDREVLTRILSRVLRSG